MSGASLDPGSLRFQDYERLAHFLTRKLCGWAQARGANPDYGDLFQEVALVWSVCRDQFDPSRGVKFSAYFAQAALHHWGKLRRQIQRDKRMVSFDHSPSQEMEQAMWDALPDERACNPESQVLREETIEGLLEANPLLARLVELSVDPPDELTHELAAMRSQVAWAQELGVHDLDAPPVALTPRLLSKTFRFNWRHRQILQSETSKAFP
jgi:hypothetical protein